MSPRAVLVGLPGAGKSTIGRRLSHALNVPVVDTDDLIEAAEGMTCGEIFARRGEPYFRDREESAVRDALATDGIVSLGGGSVLSAATRAALADHLVVHLHITPEEGIRRTVAAGGRPLLEAPDPEARYRELADERQHLYEEVATVTVHGDGKEPQRVVTDILRFIDEITCDAASGEGAR
ncbi:shikimate kinase [Corynebacterium bovis]|uniref:shikimate kinase n=1 Tax=Corynebacterium bovis TaxID=36808 RepID=UPI003139063E